jgi:hypothetical protein
MPQPTYPQAVSYCLRICSPPHAVYSWDGVMRVLARRVSAISASHRRREGVTLTAHIGCFDIGQ